MLIRVHDLEIHRQDFGQQLPPGAIDFGPELRQIGDLKVEGWAELVREHRGGREYVDDIRLVGSLAGRVELNCARCLEPVQEPVERSFDLIYRPLGVDRRKEEVSISQAETEIGYYEGEGLEVDDTLREQVLLALPLKAVCSPDCKGLCLRCGQNLNQGGCDCDSRKQDSAPEQTNERLPGTPDPRWHALRDLKQRLH